MAHDDAKYWRERHRSVRGIQAVGCRTKSLTENEREYAVAATRLRSYIAADLPFKHRGNVLDIGYGQGHHARVIDGMAFADYLGLDVAAPVGPALSNTRYAYLQGDIAETGPPRIRHDLVLALDVLFHITDDARFERAIANIRACSKRVIYVTGLFTPGQVSTAPHVRHRPLDRFLPLGDVIAVSPWRDTDILRIRVRP